MYLRDYMRRREREDERERDKERMWWDKYEEWNHLRLWLTSLERQDELNRIRQRESDSQR